MRAAALLLTTAMLTLGACFLPPLDLEGLACSEQQPCSGTYACIDGRCRETTTTDAGSARDAGGPADAGNGLDAGSGRDAGNDAGSTCSAWLDAFSCVDFDDYRQGTGWQTSPEATITIETYPDPNGATGSARLHVGPRGYAYLRSPSVLFRRSDVTKHVRATTSFVLERGAKAATVMVLHLSQQHRLALAYDGAGAASLTEERPDGGRIVTHQFALPANGGSWWFEVVGDFSGDAGVWLGISEGWTNASSRALIPIDPTSEYAAADFGIISADGGGDLILDFGAVETW
jgi:hypothetical protein